MLLALLGAWRTYNDSLILYDRGTWFRPMRLFIRHIAVIMIGAALAAAQQQSPPNTNFSGRWRMVKDQSNFGGFNTPDMVVLVVDQHGTAMNVHIVETVAGKTHFSDVVYYTDGRVANNIINGHDAESRTFWDGTALMVRTYEKNSKNQDVMMLDRWQLSADGQTLTMTSHITTEKGEADIKMVCLKEKTGKE
jgi:hypothetical protein